MFLVSAPYTAEKVQPTYFNVIIDGGAPIKSPPVAGALKFDLSGLISGTHTVNVAACNEWGCSSMVPFVFSNIPPEVPTGLVLQP